MKLPAPGCPWLAGRLHCLLLRLGVSGCTSKTLGLAAGPHISKSGVLGTTLYLISSKEWSLAFNIRPTVVVVGGRLPLAPSWAREYVREATRHDSMLNYAMLDAFGRFSSKNICRTHNVLD